MLNRTTKKKLLTTLGTATLFCSQAKAVHANEKGNAILTRDIASLFTQQPIGSLQTHLTNDNKNHLEIFLALHYQDISKDAFDHLAHLRKTIKDNVH